MRTNPTPVRRRSSVRARADAVQKMLALGLQRFLLFDVGNVNVAVMVGVMKFRKRVVMRRTLHAGVENPDFFQLRHVVINDHPLAADDGHFAHFSRIQPTAVDDGRTLPGKTQPHGGHVFDSRRDVRAALAVDRDRLFVHDVQDDGNVVRRQIPGDIDVFLEKPKIQPPGADVTDFADVAACCTISLIFRTAGE